MTKKETMTVTAIMKLIGQTESGISKSTGNQWQSKYIVAEVEEAEGRKCTIALQTTNKDIISQIDGMMEGDKMEIDFGIVSRSRSFLRKSDNSEGISRWNDCYIRSIKTIDEKGF